MVHYLPSTKQQRHTVSNQLVSIVKHLAAKITLRRWWRDDREYWTYTCQVARNTIPDET